MHRMGTRKKARRRHLPQTVGVGPIGNNRTTNLPENNAPQGFPGVGVGLERSGREGRGARVAGLEPGVGKGTGTGKEKGKEKAGSVFEPVRKSEDS